MKLTSLYHEDCEQQTTVALAGSDQVESQGGGWSSSTPDLGEEDHFILMSSSELNKNME